MGKEVGKQKKLTQVSTTEFSAKDLERIYQTVRSLEALLKNLEEITKILSTTSRDTITSLISMLEACKVKLIESIPKEVYKEKVKDPTHYQLIGEVVLLQSILKEYLTILKSLNLEGYKTLWETVTSLKDTNK